MMATTAKSQVMAILCAPITELRRRTSSSNNKIGDDREGELEPQESQLSVRGVKSISSGGQVAPIIHHRGEDTSSSVPPPPLPPSTMVKWIQSTAMFRAWAEDWVLRPSEDALFRIPIKDHYLFVSVSPTLGLVRHSWFHVPGEVRGSVGNDSSRAMILRKLRFNSASHMREYAIEELGGDGEAPKRVWSLETSCCSLFCNRKWIVGIQDENFHVWQVSGVGGDHASSSSSSSSGVAYCNFGGIEAMCAIFSPFSDDVLMLFDSEAGAAGGCVTFCDLQASVNEGKFVAKRKVLCGESHPYGFIQRPDGSVCTLHREPCIIVDNSTGKSMAQFPKYATVVPIGTSHIFVTKEDAPNFEVYHNGSITSAPTLSVPCTWAATSRGVKSQLIVSTTHSSETGITEIKLAVHDCATGFHVGDFSFRLICGTSLLLNFKITAYLVGDERESESDQHRNCGTAGSWEDLSC
ncbi:hypothetical protein Pelo_18578 [Pelomyxa schiedti]|nr:hypothetical protein Pelo_18578 [Pelomyxa schiedti]